MAKNDAEKEASPDARPKKKGKAKILILGMAALALIGGGGAALGFYVAGNAAHKAEDPNKPKLSKRGAETAAKTVEPEKDAGGPKMDAQLNGRGLPDTPADPTGYQATYYKIETPFTSNLKESDSFIQLSLGIATYYDERVIQNVQAHEMALRSAVILALSQQDELILATPAGKAMLQDQLTKAFNQTLREKTGFGGIDNVYFTSLVVQ
jgi:flagellar protein FliL